MLKVSISKSQSCKFIVTRIYIGIDAKWSSAHFMQNAQHCKYGIESGFSLLFEACSRNVRVHAFCESVCVCLPEMQTDLL